MSAAHQDVRYALRMLLKSPGFAITAVITLTLGIGMTTAIFSVVYGVLLRPLPYERPDGIVELHEINERGRRTQFADANFQDIGSQSGSLNGVAEYNWVIQSVAGGAEPARAVVSAVSREFFPVIRIQPMLGRGFQPEDQRFGAAGVALVGYGYWKQFLGGTIDLSSRTLTIENRPFTVIGVLPPDFSFPQGAEIWVPREVYESHGRTAHNWHVLGRLRDGASLSETRAELQTIAARLKRQYGPDTNMTDVDVEPLRDALTRDVRPALWILPGAVGFLLLIACANVANLLLVQSAARQREIAIRVALGASRSRVVRQHLAETLVLSAAGGAFGVPAAYWAVQALLAASPDALPRTGDVAISAPVLIFSASLCVVVAAALGVFTGVRSSAGVNQALAAGGRSQTGGHVSQRMSRTIVAGQLAITLTLLAGAALLGRSLLRVLSIDPGFRTGHVVTMNLALSPTGPPDAKVRRVRFLNQLFERLLSLESSRWAAPATSR